MALECRSRGGREEGGTLVTTLDGRCGNVDALKMKTRGPADTEAEQATHREASLPDDGDADESRRLPRRRTLVAMRSRPVAGPTKSVPSSASLKVGLAATLDPKTAEFARRVAPTLAPAAAMTTASILHGQLRAQARGPSGPPSSGFDNPR